MKKILFLIPTLGHGGAEKVLVNLVNNMDKEKFDITVQTLFDEGVNKQYLNSDIRYESFMKHAFRGNSRIMALLPAGLLHRHIVKERYDVIVSYLEGPTTHIISGCPHVDTKRVAWIHTGFNNARLFKRGFITKNKAIRAYKNIDCIICVSESVKNLFEIIAGTRFDNIGVLYNTNETDAIKELAHEPVTDITFNNNTVNVFSVGKLMHLKGYDRLAHVHKRLLDEGLNHRIYILGEGEKRGELEKYITDNHLEESFVLLGFKENPYRYMAVADMYVCSSRREGFSTAVTEALILGKPVVSTCCSGAYELLGNNNEYGIVTDNTEDGIYEGMKTMLNDDVLRREYAVKAAERGKAFSTEKTVKAVEEMLLSL